jgi:hypothetical protein
MSDAARLRGIKAQRHGRNFEAMIEAANKHYRAQLLAFVDHYGPRTHFIKRGVVRAAGKGPPDYVGFMAGGQAVAFEAKSYGCSESHTIKERMHQFEALKEMQGIALTPYFGYLFHWQKRDGGVTTWHPITRIERPALSQGITLRFEEGIAVPDLEGIPGAPDWLAVLQSLGRLDDWLRCSTEP